MWKDTAEKKARLAELASKEEKEDLRAPETGTTGQERPPRVRKPLVEFSPDVRVREMRWHPDDKSDAEVAKSRGGRVRGAARSLISTDPAAHDPAGYAWAVLEMREQRAARRRKRAEE
ncbi:hypothetical protein LTS18_002253, partial [Coniosporium uncinatum]